MTTSADSAIPVYRPDLSGRERELLLDAFDSGWISGRGPYIERFEHDFARVVGRQHAIAVSNGTVALSLALAALAVGAGDEVVVPTYTYVACANTVRNAGAAPVLCDARADTLQPDLADLLGRVGDRTAAVVVPHLFGFVQDLREVRADLGGRGVFLVEDCSQALGASIGGRPAGTQAIASTYSFFGNKTITTGEGGMVTTDDDALADLMRRLRNQGMSESAPYHHDLVAFNFRMTNLQAAIGVAQLERLETTLQRKREIADGYRDRLAGTGIRLLGDPTGGRSAQWLVTAVLPDAVGREALIRDLQRDGIDIRPGFVPMHRLPMYQRDPLGYPQTEQFHRKVVCLPSFPALREDEVERVAEAIRGWIGDDE